MAFSDSDNSRYLLKQYNSSWNVTNHTRRAMLASTGLALLAGCSSGDTSSSGGSDEAEPEPVTFLDDTSVVEEDEYVWWEPSLDETWTLSLSATVRSGPAVDIVFMEASEFSEYEQGNRFRYFEDLSLLDTAGGDVSATFEPGEYVLLLDNTDEIEAQPPTNFDDDSAEVDITVVGE